MAVNKRNIDLSLHTIDGQRMIPANTLNIRLIEAQSAERSVFLLFTVM